MDSKTQRIDKISISLQASILEALKKMDKTYKRLLLVFENNLFINVLSIGDIQRAIIKNVALNTPIREILRKETRLAYDFESFNTIKQRMLQYRAECMPVIDKQGTLKDIYFWEDVFLPEEKRTKNKLNLPVVIMAGGKGTRLKPLTNILPKALIPVEEKTMIENIMDNFLAYGSDEFYISVNYKAEMIKYYFNTLNNKDYKIKYIEEDEPSGTAGSLFLLKREIGKPFFISNCDILIDEDYSEIFAYHRENNNEITIVAVLKNYSIPYGTIETGNNGKLISLKEKPEITYKINSGMYILDPHLLGEIPERSVFHITDLIEKIKHRNGRIGVFPVSEGSWTDIGELNKYFSLINYRKRNSV